MNTTIKGKHLRDYDKARSADKSTLPYVEIDYYLRDDERVNDEVLNKMYSIDLTKFNSEDLKKLRGYFVNLKNKEFDKNIKAIDKWGELVNDPINAEIKSIQSLEKLFSKMLEKQKTKIFFYRQEDGTYYPVLLEKYEKTHDRDEGESFYYLKFAFNRIRLKGGQYEEGEEQGVAKVNKEEVSMCLWKNDLSKSATDIFNDDTECLTLIEILKKKNIYLYHEDYMDNYKLELERFLTLSKKIGSQYYAKGKSIIQSGWWFWSDSMFSDVDTKVIVEEIDNSIYNRIYTFEKKIGRGAEPIPFHPYMKCYDLINHRYILISANNLDEYKYNDKLIDQLVIDPAIKDIISIIVNSNNDYNDFIKGKSKGRIIMSTGDPGLGKTLTSEVYAELVHKPLYKIQSAQLGNKPEIIEQKLKTILSNAYRRGCVLLIDEADTYVRNRGEDITQNCIIGVFLRLLEYYEGILFMTSNKGDEIDDAILSRCTIHITYKHPTKEQAIEIFEKLSELNNFKIAKTEIIKILGKYEKISGRAIGTIVKNLQKLSEVRKQPATCDMFNSIEQFIYLNK